MWSKPILVLGLSVSMSCNLLTSASASAQVGVQNSISPRGSVVPTEPAPKREARNHQKNRRNRSNAQEDVDIDAEALDNNKAKASETKNQPLKGSLTYVDLSQSLNQGVNRLTRSALERNAKYIEASKAVDHYRTKFQRSVRFAKDALNYALPYRGFSMSIEGSRVILDKNQKLTNLCLAELAKQRYLDEMHPKIMARIMQISMGLGLQNPEESQQAVRKGVDGLADLVGKDAADSTLADLTEWSKQLDVADAAFQQHIWDVDTLDRVYHKSLKVAEDGDPVVDQICKACKKFDHGKLANFVGSMVESNLAAMTLMGGNPLVSIGAEAASTAFVMGTGGPEENKILKELYFGRRIEIRRKRISDEVELALSNYEKALLTHNRPQLAASEMTLAQLVGPEALPEVLERDPISDIAFTSPIELAKEAKK